MARFMVFVYVAFSLSMHLQNTTKNRNSLQQIQEAFRRTSPTTIFIFFQQLENNDPQTVAVVP